MVAYIFNRDDNKDIRRKLRKNEPATERLLWSHLRNRQLLGLKFRRQYGVGNYVIDFYCTETKLGIEIDGNSHFENSVVIVKDKLRQEFIESLGITVYRFTNREVMENVEGVLEVISKFVREHNLT